MDARKDDLRLDLRIAVAHVSRESRVACYRAIIVFGTAVALLVTVVSAPLLDGYALVFGILTGTLCVRGTRGEHLLHLGAELAGRVHPGSNLFNRKGGCEQVRARAISPGDYVSSREDHQMSQEEYRKKRMEALEQHELREKERRLEHEAAWGNQRSYYPNTFHYAERPPKKRFHGVLFVRHRPDSKLVFTTLEGELRPYDPGEAFDRYPRGSRFDADTTRIAECLSDLLHLVAGAVRQEAEIIAELCRSRSDAEVRHALRAGMAAGLLRRQVTLKRSLFEFVHALHPETRFDPASLRTLLLTEHGSTWVRVDRHPKDSLMPEQNKPVPSVNFYGDAYFSDSTVTGDVNKTTYIDNHYSEIVGVLERVISLVQENNGQLHNFTRVPEEVEQLRGATQVLQGSIARGELQTPRARQALNILARVGEGLIVGVAGNTLFEQFKQVLEILSG